MPSKEEDLDRYKAKQKQRNPGSLTPQMKSIKEREENQAAPQKPRVRRTPPTPPTTQEWNAKRSFEHRVVGNLGPGQSGGTGEQSKGAKVASVFRDLKNKTKGDSGLYNRRTAGRSIPMTGQRREAIKRYLKKRNPGGGRF